MTTYHIGADVDSRITELAVLGGRTIKYFTVPTAIPPLLEVLKAVAGRKVLVIEEGPMADWFCRHLRPVVHELVICDPRRNKLICQDGDKTNRIDARKLAELSLANMLRPVHHSDDQNLVCLKQWVSLYLDRVAQGFCRRLMIFLPPQHGKSELVSRRFPAFVLGRDPDLRLILDRWPTLPEAVRRRVVGLVRDGR